MIPIKMCEMKACSRQDLSYSLFSAHKVLMSLRGGGLGVPTVPQDTIHRADQ